MRLLLDNLLTVTLEAHHEGKNHHRRYEVVIGRDLLDDWTLVIRYGRVGSASQIRHYAATQPDVVRAIIRERLLRRLSAPKRIGCSYRLTALHAAPDLNPSDWLPNEIMARFFPKA
jgi:predicted DNA-binding WGR domain protein